LFIAAQREDEQVGPHTHRTPEREESDYDLEEVPPLIVVGETPLDSEVAAASGEPRPGPSGVQNNDEFRHILGDIEVPEGVDPSFLAALPEDMRQEVIAEHLRYTITIILNILFPRSHENPVSTLILHLARKGSLGLSSIYYIIPIYRP